MKDELGVNQYFDIVTEKGGGGVACLGTALRNYLRFWRETKVTLGQSDSPTLILIVFPFLQFWSHHEGVFFRDVLYLA